MNKTIVIGTVVFLVVVGGIFLYLAIPSSPSSEEEYSATPTKWSQAGDYKIEETPTGTIVTNEKAGFSFKVPDGWQVKGGNFGDIYSLDLLGPNAIFQNEVFLESGCIGSVETQSNKDFVRSVSETIKMISKKPNLYSDKKVIEIEGRAALKTTVSNEEEMYSELISVEVPLTEEILFALDFTERSVTKELCTKNFDSILASLIFD